ncbi:MAG: rhomboid family intramembrane serine protease, partial [Bacteroidota bacterium]
ALFNNALLGASGVVFMMILLVSFANARKGTIPLTFILIALLFLGKEIYSALFTHDNISQFAHIIGGLCGGVFGYVISPKIEKQVSAPKKETVGVGDSSFTLDDPTDIV